MWRFTRTTISESMFGTEVSHSMMSIVSWVKMELQVTRKREERIGVEIKLLSSLRKLLPQTYEYLHCIFSMMTCFRRHIGAKKLRQGKGEDCIGLQAVRDGAYVRFWVRYSKAVLEVFQRCEAFVFAFNGTGPR